MFSDVKSFRIILDANLRTKYTGAGTGTAIPRTEFLAQQGSQNNDNMYHPFTGIEEFELACTIIEQHITRATVTALMPKFKSLPIGSFTSYHTLRQKVLRTHDPNLSDSWLQGEITYDLDSGKKEELVFYWRSPAQIIRHLVREPIYKDDLIFAPVQEFNSAGKRIYHDLYSADWWWEKQVRP